MYGNAELLTPKVYTDEEIYSAALIIHPSEKLLPKYNLHVEDIAHIFEEGSNFTQLKNPIYDTYGHKFWDSEGLYMAERVDNIEIKKLIAWCSLGRGLSKKIAHKHRQYLSNESDDRIRAMRTAIKAKFDANPDLRELLLATGDREIIEYTYRKDEFFGIDNKSKQGSNILEKLLMEYRDTFEK